MSGVDRTFGKMTVGDVVVADGPLPVDRIIVEHERIGPNRVHIRTVDATGRQHTENSNPRARHVIIPAHLADIELIVAADAYRVATENPPAPVDAAVVDALAALAEARRPRTLEEERAGGPDAATREQQAMAGLLAGPAMHVYDEEEDGPTMLLRLPVEVVETLTDIAYRHITPAMGLDGAFVDELRGQLADRRRSAGA